MAVLDRVKNVWNAFRSTDTPPQSAYFAPQSSSYRPDKPPRVVTQEKTIISSIYTRISIDAASLPIRHVRVDDEENYVEDVDSYLNKALKFEANLDQAPRSFRQDIYASLFDHGAIAIVPIDTTVDPKTSSTYDIFTLRVGEIVGWMPRHIRVRLYNEDKGERQEIVVEKKNAAIIENPLYDVVNRPNSTFQRLRNKLSLLDLVDEQSGSGKLDLIIQLPYVIKSEGRREQAEKRRKDIEFQLKDSKYGIAYTDGTEKITQLNRPAENNLLGQIEYLTKMLYSQLGITEEILNGTAGEADLLNYFRSTIEPLVDAVTEGMQRSFLGLFGANKNHRIKAFRDPFKFVPVSSLAEIADKFTRNEILTANEIRSFMGIKPSSDPKADKLMNSNMPQPTEPDPSVDSLER